MTPLLTLTLFNSNYNTCFLPKSPWKHFNLKPLLLLLHLLLFFKSRLHTGLSELIQRMISRCHQRKFSLISPMAPDPVHKIYSCVLWVEPCSHWSAQQLSGRLIFIIISPETNYFCEQCHIHHMYELTLLSVDFAWLLCVIWTYRVFDAKRDMYYAKQIIYYCVHRVNPLGKGNSISLFIHVLYHMLNCGLF